MKIRTNYVSNSSSSSYIVKYKRGKTITIGNTYYSIEDVRSFLERASSRIYETFISCASKDNYRDKIQSDEYLTPEEKIDALKIFNYVAEDEELLCFDLDYSDKTIKKFIFSLSELNLFEVISIDGSIVV